MDHPDPQWRTSSFSGNNGNSCVGVAFLPDGGVGVRDTKDRTRPPHHHSAAAGAGFLRDIRADRFGPR